jgi:hypothetical protein
MREHSKQRKIEKEGTNFCRLDVIIAQLATTGSPNRLNPLHPSLDVGAQPLQALIKTVTTRGASGLWEHKAVSQGIY